MSGGMKLAPLLVTAAVVTGGSDEVKTGADKIINTVLEVKTMVEMKAIVKVVRLDLIAGDPFPRDIVEYARMNMDSQGTDPGKDAWGSEWEVVRNRDGSRVLISCGPDTYCGTEDDLTELILDKSGKFRATRY